MVNVLVPIGRVCVQTLECLVQTVVQPEHQGIGLRVPGPLPCALAGCVAARDAGPRYIHPNRADLVRHYEIWEYC